MGEVDAFDKGQDEPARSICMALHGLIEDSLQASVSKLYHGSPAWFIDENPIVGYSIKKEGVALLFWSGQSFAAEGLRAIGKHKAAEAIYKTREEIEEGKIKAWLGESIKTQWNYKDIVKNKGELTLL